MKFRIRNLHGKSSTAFLDNSTATVACLKNLINQLIGSNNYSIRLGYPPRTIHLSAYPPHQMLVDTDIKLDDEMLLVIPLSPTPDPQQNSFVESSSAPPSNPLYNERMSKSLELQDPPELPLPDREGTLTLRVMPDDNSCMFRAIAIALFGPEGCDSSITSLRQMVASTVLSDPVKFNKSILQHDPVYYAQWIQKSTSWGGAIELSILSQLLDIEICSVSVKGVQVVRFNETAETRCILVYSGIHYDLIALNSSSPPHIHADAPPDADLLTFSSTDNLILDASKKLCSILEQRGYYTETSLMSVRCTRCDWRGQGEAETIAHAKQTGHNEYTKY